MAPRLVNLGPPPPRAGVPLSLNVAIIFAFIVLTVAMAARRLMDIRGLPSWVWLLLVAATGVPTWVAAVVLNPGEPIQTARLATVHETASLEIPPGHSLLIHGENATTEKPEPLRSNYTLKLDGQGWTQKVAGEIRHQSKGEDGPRVDAFGGAQIQDRKSRRAGNFGEELEQRVDPAGAGKATVELSLLSGGALDAVLVDVIPAPPDLRLLWGIAVVVAILGLIAEVKYGAIQLGGDVAFLALFAVFVRDRVSAADAMRESAGAALAAGLLGWGAVGGLAYLLAKSAERKSAAADAKGEAKKAGTS